MKNNIVKSLNNLKEKDVYSLILFVLYKLHDTAEYSTLSELVYVLDADTLFKFISLFGGMTIKVPTARELNTIVQALQLYDKVNFKGAQLKSAIKEISKDEISFKDLEEVYKTVCEVLSEYTFESRV